MSEHNLQLLREKIRDKKMHTLMDALGIEVTYLGTDSMRASMPVDGRTVQYFNILHGGASVALAETLASCAAAVHVDLSKQTVVGLEINANHLRGVSGGLGFKVHGEATPVHIGRKTQVWAIEIKNDEGKLVCISRCTLAIVDIPK
ncbi:MAG: hotdog fold thioesterase [Bdellovibrionota bacterium]